MARILSADIEGLRETAAAVANGGLVCYPTDTVYGLGCDPLNNGAVNALIRVKGGRTKPIPVLVRSLEDARKIAFVSEKAELLAEQFWPGPLTLILPSREQVPVSVAPNGTVGVRSPNNAICLSLLSLCSGLICGTSANLTGRAPALSAEEAAVQLSSHVDIILDGGRATLGVASTVIDVSERVDVIREGPISREEILRCLEAAGEDSN